MSKKNDKRLCWNCEGGVSHHLTQCPYCGVDVTQPKEENSIFKGYTASSNIGLEQSIPQPPFAINSHTKNLAVSKEEWERALNAEKEEQKEEQISNVTKKEVMAFLLLLPGIVFCLFGIILTLFSTDGVLSLQWNQNVAYFYFLGALPLLYLGWRAFR